jgi:hypothetical protein
MPTLARLLLASACLLMAPLVVMADELPEDTNKIESLTVEQAQRLAKTFPGVEVMFEGFSRPNCLPLNCLKKLDADVAQALAGYSTGPLLLNGLTTLCDEAAKALTQHKGWNGQLPNLTTLDSPDSAPPSIAHLSPIDRVRLWAQMVDEGDRLVYEGFLRRHGEAAARRAMQEWLDRRAADGVAAKARMLASPGPLMRPHGE